MQSTIGLFSPLAFGSMTRGTRARKYIGHTTREIVAENLRIALDKAYPGMENQAKLFSDEHEGIAYGTVFRMANGTVGVSVDTLELIAKKLKIPVYRFFIPTAEMRKQLEVPDEQSLVEVDERAFRTPERLRKSSISPQGTRRIKE